MPDRLTVVDFPTPFRDTDPSAREAFDVLRATVGRVTSLLIIPLVMSETGVAKVGAAGGTAFTQSQDTLHLDDALIDQVRLTGYGGSSGSGDSVRAKHGSTVLCTAPLAASAALFVGPWTVVELPANDLAYTLEVVGDGVRTQTIYRAVLQVRTLRARI